MDTQQITGNLGRDAKNITDGQVPKVRLSVATKKKGQTVWISADMQGSLAQVFAHAKSGDRVTIAGDLKSLEGKDGKSYNVMDVTKAYKHQNIDIEATVMKAPTKGDKTRSPVNVFTLAKTDGKNLIINVTDFLNKDTTMALQKGEKIQIKGDARISHNKNARPGTHDFKYEAINPKITRLEIEQSVDKGKDDKPQQKASEKDKTASTASKDKATSSPKEQKQEFIASTDNHRLFKVGKTYEVIQKNHNNYTLKSELTNGRDALKEMKALETQYQIDQGVPKPKVKAKTTKVSPYPPTVDRTAVKKPDKTITKKPKISV